MEEQTVNADFMNKIIFSDEYNFHFNCFIFILIGSENPQEVA